jgi:hypothetical protein
MAVEDSKEIGDLLELREEAIVQIKVMMLIKDHFVISYKNIRYNIGIIEKKVLT